MDNIDNNVDNNAENAEQNKEAQLMDTEIMPEEQAMPEFDPSTLPDFVPDEEKLAKLQGKGKVRSGFWGIVYLHSKTILNTVLIICLFGITIGQLLNSVFVTMASLLIIAIGIIANYTIVNMK